MRKEKAELIESAIKKTADFLETGIVKEEAWTWNVFRKRFRYLDKEGRRYKAFSRKGENIIVSVSASPKDKKTPFSEKSREFIIAEERVYRKTDRQLVLDFISSFFGRRNYDVHFLGQKEKKLPYQRWKKALMAEGEHFAEIEITKTFPFWEVRLKDAGESGPYFCTQNFHFVFKLKSCIAAEEKDKISNILIEYEEKDTEDYRLLSFASVKKAIYGYNSPNLRAFYSDEGLFPEVQHGVRQTVYANLAVAIINASVFVRVAERLQGNTWYTLAAGVLVFIRAPAEVFYVKKSLAISKHLPSTRAKDTLESDEFREFSERKDVRIWRNFEKKLYDIVKKKDNFTLLLEKYDSIKKDINEALKEQNRENIYDVLKTELMFTDEDMAEIRYFVSHLEPLDIKKITEGLMESMELLFKKRVFKPNADLSLKKYIEEIFPINLLNTTFSKTFKIVRDRIKQEERLPSNEDVSRLVSTCKKQILPFRLMDILLFVSLYAMGYAATFIAGLPDMFVPLYYILYGAAANVINAAVLRIGYQVSMQYIYRNLGNAPTVSSAADAWNEYNSHLMRIWAIFSSLGLIIGVSGKLLSDATHGISRYAVELFALILYIKAFREWYFYYSELETKIKTEARK